jgi:D-3-phosphoglycerate dehydrogenase
MRPEILVAESSGFSTKAAACLRASGSLVLKDLDRPGLLASVTAADILWVRLRHKIDREVMNAAPHLRAIATPTTGLNHIDLAEARQRNIHVISLQGATQFLQNVYATGEHTVALILGLLRHLPAARDHVVKGNWNRDLFVGHDLHGKTAGLIGYGRVGQMVAGYLRALGMRVFVTDKPGTRKPTPPGIKMVSLSYLLGISDVVSLHVPLTETTRGFFGEGEFARMKPNSWFINTARGELVDERALVRALDDGRIQGAALDVLCDEHSSDMTENSLIQYARRHDNLLITPHIGGCTHESREKTEYFLATCVASFLDAHCSHPEPGSNARPLHRATTAIFDSQ